MVIYPYQRPVYAALRKAFWAHHRSLAVDLPVRPRNHRLLVGQTGTGKTHLTRQVADELNWAVFQVDVPSWVIMGARGTPTWNNLFAWLSKVDPGRPVCIIMDEIDKVYGEESWSRFLRSELLGILDGRIPEGDFEVECETPEEVQSATKNAEAAFKRAMIVGCGAFQHVFEEPPPMGFNSPATETPNSDKLAKTLQRELVNRFHKDILSLPILRIADYHGMMDTACENLPSDAAEIIRRIGPEQVEGAVRCQSGARFLGGLMARVFEELTAYEEPVVWEPRPKPGQKLQKTIFDPWDVSIP